MTEADNFKIKMILGLFTVEKGRLKVLTYKKTGEPYKNYWILVSKPLSYDESFEENTESLLSTYLGKTDVYKEIFKPFEDKEEHLDDKVVHITTIGIIDSATALYQKKEDIEKQSEWFDVELIPKLAYNYAEIIETMYEYLKKKLKDTDMIKLLFPSDFTIPEIQSFCEQIGGKSFDRRNFRKKIMALDIIEETGYFSSIGSGRPAKLYKFKENIKELNLF